MSLDDDALVELARRRAHTLYEGSSTPHRSCGVAIAETFHRPMQSYQALRKGGITGCGECGAIKGGELVLGEILGDPDPTGPVTDALRVAATRYRELWRRSLDPATHPSIICNDLTASFAAFRSPERHHFCTQLATMVAGCVATTLLEVAQHQEQTGDASGAMKSPDWIDDLVSHVEQLHEK